MDMVAKAEIPAYGCPALGQPFTESFVFLKYVCETYALYFSVMCANFQTFQINISKNILGTNFSGFMFYVTCRLVSILGGLACRCLDLDCDRPPIEVYFVVGIGNTCNCYHMCIHCI
jgi:hypothetical protein